MAVLNGGYLVRLLFISLLDLFKKGTKKMNALELANKLEQGHWEGGTREQAATMLRQQQDRLEHLEKMIVWYQDITMTGTNSEEYENGFWDAVDFVKQHQVKE